MEDFDPANCVELSENERVAIDGTTTYEAGGFLAWTNAKTTVNNVYKVGDDVYTLDTAEVPGYVGDADATFVTLKKAGSDDLYLVKADDGKYVTGATVYSDVGKRAKAAVDEAFAVEVVTPKLTVVDGETPTYKIGEDVYTLSTTTEGHAPGYYALTAEGKDTYYVASATPADNANLYSDPGHDAEAAVVAANATDSGNTLTADTEGGEAAITPGSVNSARIKDAEAGDVTPTRWTPPASGDYIFRRSIDTSAAGTLDDVDNPDVVKYTYAGYHYDADSGKYYKIVIGNDAYPTMSLTGDGKYVYDISAKSSSLGDVEIDKDGAITSDDVKVRYVTLNEVVNKKPTLTYGDTEDLDGDENAEKYLLASYIDDVGVNAEIDAKKAELTTAQNDLKEAQKALESASTLRAQKEVDYQDALGAYNSALSRYTQAKADYDYAKALADATNNLIKAANDRAAVESTKDTAADALKAAATALRGEASGLLSGNGWIGTIAGITGTPLKDATSVIGNYKLISQDTRDHITAYNAQYNNALSNVTANLTEFDASYAKIQGYIKNIETNLNTLAAIKDDESPKTKAIFDQYATATAVETCTKAVEDNYALLAAELETYARLYTDIKEATVSETNLTGLDYTEDNPVNTFISNATNGFAKLDLTALRTKTNTYKDKWTDCDNQFKTGGILEEANQTWENDVKAYNAAVSAAKDKYDAIITKGSLGDPDNNAGKILKNDETPSTDTMDNNGATLVPYDGTSKTAGYSASFDGSGKAGTGTTGDDPEIAEDVDWEVYTTTTYSSKPLDKNTKKAKTASTAEADQEAIAIQTVETEAAFTELTPRDIWAGTATAKPLGELTVDPNGKITDATADTLAAELKTAYEALYGTDTTDGAAKEYQDAKDAYDTAEADKQAANDTIQALNTTIGNLTDKSDIKIYIVLDKDVTQNWTIDPADATVAGSEEVDFYLNKILEAGETSPKLIDYVMLDKNVNSLDYKNLVFDLNVGLDSVQVTYDENQRDYTATAVNVDDNDFDLVATVGNDNSKVTWETKEEAAAPKYTVRGTKVTPTALTENNEIAGTTYNYQIKTSYGTFWTTSETLENGTEFVKVNLTTPAEPALATDDGTTMKVTLDVTTE